MSCDVDGLFPLGSFVTVTRGRGEGKIFVVIGFSGDGRCLIANGDDISARKPKRKSPKHLNGMRHISRAIRSRLAMGKAIDDGWLHEILADPNDKITTCS